MTDVSQVADSDLLASLPVGVRNNNPLNLKDPASGQLRSFPSSDAGLAAADQNLQAYYTKHGLNTVAGVVGRWAPAGVDGNNTAAYTAHVAQRLGVDPAVPLDMTDAPTRQRMLSAMGEFENGGPTVPVSQDDLGKVSDADLMASLEGAAPTATAPAAQPPSAASPPVLRSHNGGVTIGLAGPDDAPAATKTSTPADMVHGYLSGLGGSMAQTADSVANFIPGLGGIDRLLSTGSVRQALVPDPLHMIGGLAQKLLQRRGGDYAPQTVPGQYAKAVGQYTPAAAMPGSIPARVANVVIPALASEGAGQAAQAAGASPALQSAARVAGGIAGGGVASLRVNPGAARAPNILDAVRAARRAAYADVESAGAVIPQPAMQDLAQNVTDLVRTTAGPDGAAAYPAAHAMASRLSSMAESPDGVTLPQLDTLRSDIFDAMVKGGDREAPVGVAMRDHIDHAIAGTGDTNILRARDLYTRERQIQTIQDELESARLRTASTNSGQNGNNAIRQELRPLIDPTRNQQITNFPPDVLQAMNRAVTGSAGQNALRDASNMLRNRFLQGAAGLATKGVAMIPMEIGGRMLNNAAENGTVRNVQRVIDMIARGTPTSAAAAITAPRPPPLLSAPDTNPALMASLISLIPAASAAGARPTPQPPQRR